MTKQIMSSKKEFTTERKVHGRTEFFNFDTK